MAARQINISPHAIKKVSTKLLVNRIYDIAGIKLNESDIPSIFISEKGIGCIFLIEGIKHEEYL